MSLGHLYDNRVGTAFGAIVLLQFRAQLAGLDAHDGVGAGIEGLPAVEDLDADCVFLQLVRAALERVLDQMAQKPAQARGIRKRWASENP
jgi:hypothetical protein